MKIINIAGTNSPELSSLGLDILEKLDNLFPGKTGIIKEADKFPTECHTAVISAGIDEEKSVITIKEGDLSRTLDLFSDSGITYVVVERFNETDFKKIVIGDLEAENCILRNPSVEEIIECLDKFDDHYTMQGLVIELKEEVDIPKTGCYLHFNGIVREITGDERTEYIDFPDYEYIDRVIAEIKSDMEKVPGVLGVRFHHNKGRLYAGEDVTYIAVAASHRQEAFKAMMDAIDRLKSELHNKTNGTITKIIVL